MTCGNTLTAEQRLSERLMTATLHALELNGVYLGKRLGLYESLRAAPGGLTSAGLAGAARIAERYAREWLEQQAVAGLLRVENATAAAGERCYTLPIEHARVLTDDDHPSHVAPLAQMVAGIGAALPQVVEAYRTGAGVSYETYGADFRHGQAGINRPAFTHDLTGRWIPAVADVHARLLSTAHPRIADVGCGAGWSTIALAIAYPHAEVVGYDLDTASVAEAERNAEARGVTVRFSRQDAAALADDGPFDLVLVLEALHDMAQPARVLQAIRLALGPGGTVIVADENVAERFYAPGDDLERMMYGWSIVHCLPVAMTETPSAAIGTAIRPETVLTCAAGAGFARIEVLPFDSGFFRFYRLDAAADLEGAHAAPTACQPGRT
jgi:2-polyprenyl-3-methyl-5-hydroxy-6-metoxy-1,4-benzoquinol methylase